MNCRGLGDFSKRKDVFDYIRSKKASIYCLQDTHFVEKSENIIRSQWGFECLSSYGRSNSRGVSIFLITTLNFKYYQNGYYIIVNLEVEKKYKITLANTRQ